MTDTITALVSEDVVAQNERAVLGAALHSVAAFERCAQIITSADFYNPAHEMVWDAISWVNNQGSADDKAEADVILTAARLNSTGNLGAIGGAPYLHTLYAQSITPANALWYAKEVKDAAKGRGLVALGTRLAHSGAATLNADERDGLITTAIGELESINANNGKADPTAILADDLSATMDALEGGTKNAVDTGLAELDEILGGLVGGQVIVVGARPGTGKTVFAQSIVEHVAGKLNRPALMFTLEMSRIEMMARVLASVCKINSRHLNLAKPQLDESDWDKLSKGVEKVLAMPLHVCDDASITPARISALIGAFKRKHPDLGVVVIDYLQLMKGDGRTNSRQEEVSEISRAVKLMAKRHNVAIVLLSQLNRKSEERADKRPAVADLRESGSVEQDADVVILLHREDQYDTESPRAGEMDLMVEKNRSGPKGTATVSAQMHYYRLRSMAREPAAGAAGGAAW